MLRQILNFHLGRDPVWDLIEDCLEITADLEHILEAVSFCCEAGLEDEVGDRLRIEYRRVLKRLSKVPALLTV